MHISKSSRSRKFFGSFRNISLNYIITTECLDKRSLGSSWLSAEVTIISASTFPFRGRPAQKRTESEGKKKRTFQHQDKNEITVTLWQCARYTLLPYDSVPRDTLLPYDSVPRDTLLPYDSVPRDTLTLWQCVPWHTVTLWQFVPWHTVTLWQCVPWVIRFLGTQSRHCSHDSE